MSHPLTFFCPTRDRRANMFNVDTCASDAEAFVHEFMRHELERYEQRKKDDDHELLRFVRTSPIPRRIKTSWDEISHQWYWYWNRRGDDAEYKPIEFGDNLRRYYWHWSESRDGAWVPIDPVGLLRIAHRAKRMLHSS